MALSAGTLALWIGSGFALASAVAALAARPGDSRAWVAGRALTMAAAFSTLASGILVDALRRHDLTIDYVARHSTHGVGMATALLGAFSDPAGAGLLIASLLGVTGSWLARRADAPGIAGAASVTMVVLLAAPLAGRPLAVLPWTPVDGQDALLFFRQGLSVAYVVSIAGAMVASPIALGAGIDRWRGVAHRALDLSSARLALACVGIAVVTRTWASLAAGLSRDVSPIGALGGAGGVAIGVALVSALLLARDRSASQANVEAALAALLGTLAVALTSPASPEPGTAVQVLALLSIGVLAVALWHARTIVAGAVRGWRPLRLPALLGAASLGVALLAGVFDLMVRSRPGELKSGGHLVIPGGMLDHLGVSRYDDDDSQVLALALEMRQGAHTQLASSEHREYADSRGGVLGGLIRIPAIMPGVFTTITWLEAVQAGDDVTLTVVGRSPLAWWWMSLALGVAAILSTLVGRRRDAAPVSA